MNQRLSKLIKPQRLDALLISSVPNIIYLTNFFGFSKDERQAFLLITKNKQYILTDGRYSEAVKNNVKDFKLIQISPSLSFEKALRKLCKKHDVKRLGFEGHNLSFLEHQKLSKHFNKMHDLSISDLRSVKESNEILAIEKACELGDKTFDYILKKIKFGVSEKEIAFEIELFIEKQGADISFPPIVAFGKNSSIPHHQTSDQRLTSKDKFVLLDFGVKLNNYCSDMTRTVFFGKPTTEQKKMYQTVLESQKKTINYLKSLILNHKSIMAKDVDKIARDHIISKGYKTIPHSVGHGIGLEVHESPRLSPKSKDILKHGMVFSIEPGIYIPASPDGGQGGPNFGGVRIEDLVVLEKSGIKILTHSPKQFIDILTYLC